MNHNRLHSQPPPAISSTSTPLDPAPFALPPYQKFQRWLPRWLGIHAAIVLIVVGALVVGLLLLPVAALLPRYRSVEAQRGIVSKSVRFYLWVLETTGLMQVEYRGFPETTAAAAPGSLYVSTHPSLFDVLFFLARFPTCSCVVKLQLYSFSPYAPIIRRAKYIVSGKDDVVEAATQELAAGHSLIIFPEGTRSDAFIQQSPLEGVERNQLQRGAAAIAIRSQRPIQVVRITSNPRHLVRLVVGTKSL